MKIINLLFSAIVFFSLDAHVSVIANKTDLVRVIQSATYIVKAKPVAKSTTDFIVVEVLKGDDALLKANKKIEVRPADEDLFEMINELQQKGQPTPMPIVDYYNGPSAELFAKSTEVILFLAKNNKGNFRFFCNGSFETVLKQSEIVEKIKK